MNAEQLNVHQQSTAAWNIRFARSMRLARWMCSGWPATAPGVVSLAICMLSLPFSFSETTLMLNTSTVRQHAVAFMLCCCAQAVASSTNHVFSTGPSMHCTTNTFQQTNKQTCSLLVVFCTILLVVVVSHFASSVQSERHCLSGEDTRGVMQQQQQQQQQVGTRNKKGGKKRLQHPVFPGCLQAWY